MEITMSEKTKKTRRRYSDEFRASALAALEANGGNVERTAKALDIPRKTLELWRDGQNESPAELCHRKKIDLNDELERFVVRLVNHPIADDSNMKDIGIAVGIACDKLLALQGRPTIIQQSIDSRPNVIDPSKMTPAQRKALGAFLDEMSNDQTVQYDPQPGDPDYETGLNGESP